MFDKSKKYRTCELVRFYNEHQGRPLLEDLDSMLCADGLVAARSSLTFLAFGHTRATRLFVPSECGNGHWRMGVDEMATYDNATLLALERPDAKVGCIAWSMRQCLP